MKYKLLVISTLIFSLFTMAQNLNDEIIMGEWKAINVDIPNSEDVPQKEALKLIEDAFLDSKFNFKGNKVFRIKYGKLGDERMKELFFLDNQNWIIKNSQILIGTESDGFSAMHITFHENNGKIYFILPMIRLEMEKLSNDKPSEPKVVESKSGKTESADYSKSEIITKEIDESQMVEFDLVENPPLAPECKSKWNVDKRKDCTSKYINMHLIRKFNTNLAQEANVTGRIRINIEFVIDINGKPINITANGGPKIMNENAIEVIGLLPNLKAGTKNGKPVNVLYKMPLVFQIAN
ncbi:TonB-like protein [Mariniflexile fucanivorans]|uniref:TonB-like protein n=1 Tax=Mariniflexile fucanivorans TaxID=264023 RepID=A0A4R1RBL8_9FLAO|nr:energy transducer TonB [Mariniflexile fucanivorans]TCL63079.1 TonB-like protein [Mariniflexile fucanivorans]